MFYGPPVTHRASIMQRPVRSEQSLIGAENLDVIAAKEAALLEVKRQQYAATHERIHRSIYPSESDKQAYFEAHRMHMEQQVRAREAELQAEQARLGRFARPMTPNANDLHLQSQPWKATTQTAYGNQQEQDQARKVMAKSILDENKALALHNAALKAAARDEDRIEARKTLNSSSFWSAPAPPSHRRSPLASHNGAPYALHEAAPHSNYNMQPSYYTEVAADESETEVAIRSYYDRFPAAGVASIRPSSAMGPSGRNIASPHSIAPWASDLSLQPSSDRDQSRDSRPSSAQVSFPWSRDIVPQSSQRGRGEHNPGYGGGKSRPFADLEDLAQSQAATAASRVQYQQRQAPPSFPWLS